MGVWIEIVLKIHAIRHMDVTPCVGVWIEISVEVLLSATCEVTPCVGVWIEIIDTHVPQQIFHRHSLRGSVD